MKRPDGKDILFVTGLSLLLTALQLVIDPGCTPKAVDCRVEFVPQADAGRDAP